jgi:hypothetical protein
MKTLFLFLIGAAAGAYAFYSIQERQKTTAAQVPVATNTPAGTAKDQPRPSIMDQARAEAHEAKDAVAGKLSEWHLTPAEIRDDLARTGQVVRTKARAAGENIASATSNARIVTVIKAKFTIDKELSARAIEVDCDNGHVTLRGTVATHELIAKAIAIALETDGVTDVKSLITATAAGG